MEQAQSSNGTIDKSRVLDVKPIRCLVPVFPNPPTLSSVSSPQPTPFVCVSPTGPFPSGIQPFYPFVGPCGAYTAAENPTSNSGVHENISAPVPLNSFRTPTSQENGGTGPRKRASRTRVSVEVDGCSGSLNQDDQYDSGFTAAVASSSERRKGRLRKETAKSGEFDSDSLVNGYLSAFKLQQFDDFRRAKGDRGTVATLLLVYDLIRKRLTQMEETNERSVTKRPDLKVGNLLMSKGIRTNCTKRVGHVGGVEVGDIFLFRMELCLVGLHAPSMAGIDYMSFKISADEEPIAVSIVSSGGYDDDGDDADVLIYSGQGGLQRDGAMSDQKLVRGNLALEKSFHRGNEVRVVRGVKDPANATGKIYVYDGLYKIKHSWTEKNAAGCSVFKYKLERLPGQPEAFSLWKSIQQWKDGTASRPGVILPDLTSGAEIQPISLVNDVDREKGPAHFIYTPYLRYTKPFPLSKPYLGCRCPGGCQPGDTSCSCNAKNGGFIPYSSNGVLLFSKSPIYECGESCSCPPSCRNRMSQAGLKVRLEVFKTKNRGWGLRSWDPIRAGAFICVYAGDIISRNESGSEDDEYVFDSTRSYEPLEPARSSPTAGKAPLPLIISSKDTGNVARFMNHSCSPNVFWQPVISESNHDSYFHVAFFAIRHIPLMQELAYDYGTVSPDQGRRQCLCGSDVCRGYFYG